MMQAFDYSSLIPFVYVGMMLLLWLFPPRWVNQLMKDLKSNIDNLRTWAPRLMGALRGTQHEEYVTAAGKQNNLVGLLVQLAPLIERAPQILQALDELGALNALGITEEQKQEQKGGATW